MAQLGMADTAAVLSHELLEKYPIRDVVLFGFSGALDPDLKVGDLILATEVAQATWGLPIREVTLSKRILELQSPQIPLARSGRIVGSSQLALTLEHKRKLRTASSALAVDMESDSVAEVCKERGVKLHVLRAISDTAHDSIAPEFMQTIDDDGNIAWGATLGLFLRRPNLISQAIRLGRNSRIAQGNLAEGLDSLLEEILSSTNESPSTVQGELSE